MDWLIEYGEQIFVLVTLALVVGAWGYVRYWSNREGLRRDLEGLVRDGLGYLKEWAKSRMDEVTAEDVAVVSSWIYEHYVEGTALARLVTQEQLYALMLEAFMQWRDRFGAMDQAMAVYATRVRREGW